MRALKSIVRGFFAVQAVFLLLIPLAAIFGGLRSHLDRYVAQSGSDHARHVGGTLIGLGIAIGLLAVGVVFALGWWTTRKISVANRGWAIAASLVNVAEGLLTVSLTHLTKGRMTSSFGEGLWCIGLGGAGLFLFARREAAVAVAAVVEPRKSVSGDRTSAFTRHAVGVLSFVAQIAAIVIWSHWGLTHDLLRTRGLVWIALVTVASILATIIHECGHALIAWCFEMSLLSFKAGPFQWKKREGKWTFKLHLAGLLTPGGAVGAVAKDIDQPRWEEILMIAAGPLANLLIGVPAIYAVLRDEWPHYQQSWELVAFTASFCVIAAVLNLVPFLTEEGGYSDGARILQIVTQSPLEEYHRAMASIASTATTERRYRDLDVAAIQRAASLFPDEFRGLHLNLCACHCFEDRKLFPEASASLASAEAIYSKFAIDLPAPLHTVFVIGHAYLNRDASAARVWWERMEAKKNDRQNVDYWLARTALLWIEGDAKGAESAWGEADALAQLLPKFGAYEFDRYRCFLLRQALNEQAAVVETVSVPLAEVPASAVVVKDDPVASAPILPAWITPLSAPTVEVTQTADPAKDPIVERERSAVAVNTVVKPTNLYGDAASMFARLSSLTARPSESSASDLDQPQEAAAEAAPVLEVAEVEPQAPIAMEESEPSARVVAATSPIGDVDWARPGEDDPFARIRPDSGRSLPDLLGRPIAPATAAPAMWSVRPSAPPLVGAPPVTPLAVDAWTAMPAAAAQSDALRSFVPTPLETISKGPSVPAAFARRPRIIAPMPEDPFAFQQVAEQATVAPDLSDIVSVEPALVAVEAVEPATAIVVTTALEVAPVAPETANIAVASYTEMPSVETSRPVGEVLQPAPAPPPVEAPRFDPLAFIRAAALENLSTR